MLRGTSGLSHLQILEDYLEEKRRVDAPSRDRHGVRHRRSSAAERGVTAVMEEN